jgi:tRNA threonylcarbamoyladenosine biosynthesis protein TsaB
VAQEPVAVAFETSTRMPSVAVRAGGEVRVAVLEGDRPHASDLLPALDRLLRELGAPPSSVQAVFVGLGPGSYTGLRVGVATALGLALGSGARLRGVPSTELVAWQWLQAGETGASLIDARQRQLYLAVYRRTDDEVVAVHPPRVATAAEVRELLPTGVPIFGDAAAADAAELGATERARLRDCAPSARALLDLGSSRLARHGPHAPRELEPLYLRAFSAHARRR